ncbi:MAG: translation initiation factor [Caldilineaceae bacterium]|nr:translation initiation factor [Caldilineaceae bacterium]
MSKPKSGGGKSGAKNAGDKAGGNPAGEANRRLVYSTDPEPEAAAASIQLPANPAAPIRSRQQNTPVLVMLDRKGRGGKSVSVIKQVMSPPAGKEALLKLIKTKLGTGGTLKDGDIEIQGDHRDIIVALLKELGYQAKRAGG